MFRNACTLASINNEIHGNFPVEKCLLRGAYVPRAKYWIKTVIYSVLIACLFIVWHTCTFEIYSFFGDPPIATKICEKVLLSTLFHGIYFRYYI